MSDRHTGPDHFREADRLARLAMRRADAWPNVSVDTMILTTALAAQTHALLAVAAATAFMPAVGNEGQTAQEWRDLIVPPKRDRTYVPDEDQGGDQ